MNTAQSLERLYANVSQPVLGTDGEKILFANGAALGALGDKIYGMSAAEVIPSEILSHNADSFYCAAEILDRQAGISVLRESGITILIMEFLGGKGSALPLTRAMILGLRTSAMGLKMSVDKCFSLLEDGVTPEKRVTSTLYHYYYSLLRAITQMDSADHLKRGDTVFSPETLDLVKLCSELADTVSLLCRGSGVTVEFSAQAQSLFCVADGAKLEQLLLNLISNSLRHTPEGGSIRLTLDVVDGRVIISVDDNGSGIPKGSALRVFALPEEREEQIPSAGYGLGLYIAYGIAHLHGGTIILESGETGTHVRVSFPLEAPEGGILKSPAANYRAGGASRVLTELADALTSGSYGPEYED